MPGIVALVSAISDEVVASLAAASYPALTDGEILLGSQHVFEQSAPPRIIFTPKSSSFGPPMAGSANISRSSTDRLRLVQQAPIATETVSFEVRCWGSYNDDIDSAYDYTQALYHQVIASVDKLARGVFALGNGAWTDTTHLVKHGREFVFSVSLDTPVLNELFAYAPGAVGHHITDTLALRDGSTEQGCES